MVKLKVEIELEEVFLKNILFCIFFFFAKRKQFTENVVGESCQNENVLMGPVFRLKLYVV